MKKVDVTFVCDICEAPLPQKFVGTNNMEQKYFDLHKYNTIRLGLGRSVDIDMTVDACHTKQRELCPKCRVNVLRDVLRSLESELEEDTSCAK